MLTPSEEIRIARSESLRREVNERIAETADRLGADDASFVCECGDPNCSHRVRATREEYEDIRSDATTFMLVDDHIEPPVEKVVERRPRFTTIAKVTPHARRLVERLDPRKRRR
jgi:hypothetical protein